jgi:hypothetical protein
MEAFEFHVRSSRILERDRDERPYWRSAELLRAWIRSAAPAPGIQASIFRQLAGNCSILRHRTEVGIAATAAAWAMRMDKVPFV